MRSGRFGAIAILALALIGYLRRRVWWSYAAGDRAAGPARPAFIARQPAERVPYVARVTDDWRALGEHALPVVGAGLLLTGRDSLLPAAWLDVTGRPDVADLPRVIRSEPLQPVTQWLYDVAAQRILLVVAADEPVSCSFAIAFDARRHARVLARAAEAEQLALVLERPPAGAADTLLVKASAAGALLLLPLDAPAQLQAMLSESSIQS
jgi:hypothetical protein